MNTHFSGDKKCFVTGATGFIGSRLIEKLWLEHEKSVKALVRNPVKAVNIGRFPIEMHQGNIMDQENLRSFVDEEAIIFHAAHHFEGTPEDNEQATKNLLAVAREKQAKRIVILSTADTYQSKHEGTIDEATPKKTNATSNYIQSKLAVEEVCHHYINQYQLPVVIIQPTIVYGPWCKPWTIRIFDQMAKGKIPLINGGTGICNAIYIDDLVDLLIEASLKPAIEGETYIANNETPLTWKDFYGYFENILESKRTLDKTYTRNLSQSKLPALGVKDKVKQPLARILPRSFKDNLKKFLSSISNKNRPIPLSKEQAEYFAAKATFKPDKAKRDLGYAQSFTYQQGFEQVAYWFRHFYQNG